MTKLEVLATKFRIKLNQAFPSAKKTFISSAIITAAGSGTRMGGISKQLMDLNGKPCIVYSLLAFEACDDITEIIVVAKEDEVDQIFELCKEFQIKKCKRVVSGGSTRQESVEKGFLSISDGSDFVLIHDAARPLITGDQISDLLNQAKRWGSATAAEKVSDSVKLSKDGAFIERTVDRSALFTVQTPQVFRSDVYRIALAYAKQNQSAVTDDCALVEDVGFPIRLCQWEAPNIKLTTRKDLDLVLAILGKRGESDASNR